MPNEQEQQSPMAAALTEYKLVTTLPNGREQWDLIVDSDIDAATRQAWGVIQEKDQAGVQITAAKLEWDSPAEGPLTEYIYDRQQGIEVSRPEGITLPPPDGPRFDRAKVDAAVREGWEASAPENSATTNQQWTLQQFAEVAGQPWFALQEHGPDGVQRQYTGRAHEVADIAAKLGATPHVLPSTSEESFYASLSHTARDYELGRLSAADPQLGTRQDFAPYNAETYAAGQQMRTMEDSIRQQTQPAAPAQVPTQQHHHHSRAARHHEQQQHQEHSIGFGY